jgi:DNA-binding LacI/PurR family transcriptional regulator
MLVPSGDTLDVDTFPIDGAFIIDPTGTETLLGTAVGSGASVITAGRVLEDRSIPWVDNDHVALTIEMLDHMAEMGYERPALLTGPENQSYAADAITAYRTWTVEHGRPQIAATVSEPPTAAAGMRAARRLLKRKRRPDAVIASFDVFALGTLAVAREMGLKVPDDFGIAGAVDSYALRTAVPPLTGFELNAGEIGREAISLLVRAIEPGDGTHDPPSVTVRAKLNRRESTQRPGDRR